MFHWIHVHNFSCRIYGHVLCNIRDFEEIPSDLPKATSNCIHGNDKSFQIDLVLMCMRHFVFGGLYSCRSQTSTLHWGLGGRHVRWMVHLWICIGFWIHLVPSRQPPTCRLFNKTWSMLTSCPEPHTRFCCFSKCVVAWAT